MNKRTLSERQVRWKSILNDLTSIKLNYRPGREVAQPDALSSLEKDTPKDPDDPRLRYRKIQLIKDSLLAVIEEA